MEIDLKFRYKENHSKEIIFQQIKRSNQLHKKMVKKYNLKFCKYHQKDNKKITKKNKK